MKPSSIANPNYIVRTTWDPAYPFNPPKHFGYTLQYNGQGELWFITQQQWTGAGCNGAEIVSCREFRGSGRNMRMTTERYPDPRYLDLIEPESRVWHDYDGEEIYADVGVTYDAGWQTTVTELASQEPGTGAYDRATSESTYHHGDQIGSTRVATTQPSGDAGRIVYTAFGEIVSSSLTPQVSSRYKYAGAYGYQTMPEYASGFSNGFDGEPGDAVPFVHVGHRWYDPATGRFLQRDPIGIEGGLNEFTYVGNSPILSIDPLGFFGRLGQIGTGMMVQGTLVRGAGAATCLIPTPWTEIVGAGMMAAGAIHGGIGAVCFIIDKAISSPPPTPPLPPACPNHRIYPWVIQQRMPAPIHWDFPWLPGT